MDAAKSNGLDAINDQPAKTQIKHDLNSTVTTVAEQVKVALSAELSPVHHFEKLRTRARQQHLSLHRQPSLGPEFGPDIFILSKRKVMATFDSLAHVEAWLGGSA